jgi:hypothetical protein
MNGDGGCTGGCMSAIDEKETCPKGWTQVSPQLPGGATPPAGLTCPASKICCVNQNTQESCAPGCAHYE